MNNSFTKDYYEYLLGLMNEAGQGEQFATFFDKQDNDFYTCNNLTGYEEFLQNLFDGEDYSEFITWSSFTPGISGQGSGTN